MRRPIWLEEKRTNASIRPVHVWQPRAAAIAARNAKRSRARPTSTAAALMPGARAELTNTERSEMRAKHKSKIKKPEKRKSPVFDPVAEASDESFPASDPPAWPSSEPAAKVNKERKGRTS